MIAAIFLLTSLLEEFDQVAGIELFAFAPGADADNVSNGHTSLDEILEELIEGVVSVADAHDGQRVDVCTSPGESGKCHEAVRVEHDISTVFEQAAHDENPDVGLSSSRRALDEREAVSQSRSKGLHLSVIKQKFTSSFHLLEDGQELSEALNGPFSASGHLLDAIERKRRRWSDVVGQLGSWAQVKIRNVTDEKVLEWERRSMVLEGHKDGLCTCNRVASDLDEDVFELAINSKSL